MTVGYFGCLRAAEYCYSPSSSRHLTVGDLMRVDASSPYFILRVSSAKNSIKGFKVILGCSQDLICAFCTLAHYLPLKSRQASDPLFASADGRPLTRQALSRAMVRFLTDAGLPSAGISPHSLRAGCATDAAAHGASDSAIKQLGRWASGAFNLYLRPSEQSQAMVASRLAFGWGPNTSSSH